MPLSVTLSTSRYPSGSYMFDVVDWLSSVVTTAEQIALMRYSGICARSCPQGKRVDRLTEAWAALIGGTGGRRLRRVRPLGGRRMQLTTLLK
jgi:hypothetical protein